MSAEDVGSLTSVPGGGDGGEVSAHGLDHSATPHPESDANANAAVQQQPDGRGLVGRHAAGCVNQPQRHQRSDGIASKGEEEGGGRYWRMWFPGGV